jgi:2-amino-4-hydroxy-6-hydroxymethyldihydropteridine diphosphokinase
MTVVFLGIGSNIDREKNLRAGVAALRTLFGEISVSPVFESESVGFAGSPFYNLVAKVETSFTVGDLQQQLRAIEYSHGRMPDQRKYSPRTLDIDILTFGESVGNVDGVVLPRAEILENAFVLWPLAVLAPESVHPVEMKRYAELWEAYDKSRQKLAVVDGLWFS